jgi:hypothetical protein
MKITKKPKTVVGMKSKVYSWVRSYNCPSCCAKFVGVPGLGDNVIRFKCECGQELIIEKWVITERIQ